MILRRTFRQFLVACNQHARGTVAQAELAENARHVRFIRGGSDEELLGNLSVVGPRAIAASTSRSLASGLRTTGALITGAVLGGFGTSSLCSRADRAALDPVG